MIFYPERSGGTPSRPSRAESDVLILACVAGIRVVEVLAALSLTTDLASGVAFEKGLRTCAVAAAFGRELGLPAEELSVVFHTALVRAIGCTSHAPENADDFDDDIAFQAWLKELDFGDEAMLSRQLARFGAWAPGRQAAMTTLFLDTAAVTGTNAWRSSCEVGRAVGPMLGLPDAVVACLDHVYERWDGHGIPGIARAADLPLAARVVHVAEQAVLAHAQDGLPGAVAEVGRRAGGHLDPDLASAFARDAEAALAPLAEPDILAAVIAAEPGTASLAGADGMRRMCQALACVVDLKGRYLLGHSHHVAAVAARAADLAGLGAEQCRQLETAGLLHDIGRAGVPSSVWDRPGPLSAAAWEQVRLHTYWTSRVLERCPALAGLAPLAASHHDGSTAPATTAARAPRTCPSRPACSPPPTRCANSPNHGPDVRPGRCRPRRASCRPRRAPARWTPTRSPRSSRPRACRGPAARVLMTSPSARSTCYAWRHGG